AKLATLQSLSPRRQAGSASSQSNASNNGPCSTAPAPTASPAPAPPHACASVYGSESHETARAHPATASNPPHATRSSVLPYRSSHEGCRSPNRGDPHILSNLSGSSSIRLRPCRPSWCNPCDCRIVTESPVEPRETPMLSST